MAQGEHRQIQVKPGDTIIISGGTIPGNEEEVGRMLNKLFERGANVIYGKLATVHVSGHGSRDEMGAMIEAVQPQVPDPGPRRDAPPAPACPAGAAHGAALRRMACSS